MHCSNVRIVSHDQAYRFDCRAVCDDYISKNVVPSEYAKPLIQNRSKPLCEMRVQLMMTICPKPLRIACLSKEFGLTMDAILRRCLAKKQSSTGW